MPPGAGSRLAGPSSRCFSESMSAAEVLDRLLDPVSCCFGEEGARSLVELRADSQAQHRTEELAAKANDGALTPMERDEYEACVQAGEVIAILQAKARLRLKGAAKS